MQNYGVPKVVQDFSSILHYDRFIQGSSWDNLGIMEKKMETVILNHVGIIGSLIRCSISISMAQACTSGSMSRQPRQKAAQRASFKVIRIVNIVKVIVAMLIMVLR